MAIFAIGLTIINVLFYILNINRKNPNRQSCSDFLFYQIYCPTIIHFISYSLLHLSTEEHQLVTVLGLARYHSLLECILGDGDKALAHFQLATLEFHYIVLH